MTTVSPEYLADQKAAGWPDVHPEEYCHACGPPEPGVVRGLGAVEPRHALRPARPLRDPVPVVLRRRVGAGGGRDGRVADVHRLGFA